MPSLWGRQGYVRQQEKQQAGTEGKAGLTPEAEAWGQGAVGIHDWGRQEEPLKERGNRSPTHSTAMDSPKVRRQQSRRDPDLPQM